MAQAFTSVTVDFAMRELAHETILVPGTCGPAARCSMLDVHGGRRLRCSFQADGFVVL